MFKKELTTLLSFYAISPIHAGSGMSTGAVDLPIQREKHTNWPHIQASAVKGAIRAHFRNFSEEKQSPINLIFGSDKNNDKNIKGFDKDLPASISISDAKLFAFPVRSNISPFIWVTSPAILKRLKRDLKFMDIELNIEIPKNLNDDQFISVNDLKSNKIILEDVVVKKDRNLELDFIKNNFSDIDKLIIVSDQIFDYLVTNCTEIQTQITIDHDKGTAKDGALRYQELLPSDSVLYSIIYFSKSSKIDTELKAEMIKDYVKNSLNNFIQIGGDETLGRGICKVNWFENSKGEN